VSVCCGGESVQLDRDSGGHVCVCVRARVYACVCVRACALSTWAICRAYTSLSLSLSLSLCVRVRVFVVLTTQDTITGRTL